MDKQAIDKLLDALIDGKWHTAEEIIDKTRIEKSKARLITSFLWEFQFIQEDKKTGRIRLSTSTKELLTKLGKTDPNSSYEEITA